MPPTLIVAATEAEIAPLRPLLPALSLPTDTLVTGVGAMHAAALLLRHLALHECRCVLHIGIAGAFDTQQYPLGTVVEVYRDRQADLGVEHADGSWTDAYALGLAETLTPYQPDGWLVNHHASPARLQLPLVSGITVNTVTGSSRNAARLHQLYQPDVESMEGAACLWACLLQRVPCHQLRSISNRVEARNRAAWDIPLALQQLHIHVQRLLPRLHHLYS